MATELFARQAVAELTGIEQNFLKHWMDCAREDWFYVEPAFFTVRIQNGDQAVGVKLWTAEQIPLIVEAVKKHRAASKKKVEDQKHKTTQRKREYQKKYYQENKDKINKRRYEAKQRDHSAEHRRTKELAEQKRLHDLKILEARLAKEQRVLDQKKAKAERERIRRAKIKAEKTKDTEEYLAEFDQERENKAMEILARMNL